VAGVPAGGATGATWSSTVACASAYASGGGMASCNRSATIATNSAPAPGSPQVDWPVDEQVQNSSPVALSVWGPFHPFRVRSASRVAAAWRCCRATVTRAASWQGLRRQLTMSFASSTKRCMKGDSSLVLSSAVLM